MTEIYISLHIHRPDGTHAFAIRQAKFTDRFFDTTDNENHLSRAFSFFRKGRKIKGKPHPKSVVLPPITGGHMEHIRILTHKQ